MTGFVHSSLDQVRALDPTKEVGVKAVVARRVSLRELLLARALYRCGDYQGLGEKVLKEYTSDLRGHLARHATAVLEKGRR
jgi:hypothetical protein